MSSNITSIDFTSLLSDEDTVGTNTRDFQSIIIGILKTSFLARPFLFTNLLSTASSNGGVGRGVDTSDESVDDSSSEGEGQLLSLDLWVLYSLSGARLF